MSVDRPGEPDVTEALVVHRRDVPQLTVHSWSRAGQMLSAWPDDGKEVPIDACEIQLRIVAFPHGSVREIYLGKEARTHPHRSYEAVLFYQIDGRRVQMVNERSHEVNPGDACLQPTGVQHSTFQLIGGLFVEFALPAPLQPDPQATWITADRTRPVKQSAGCTVELFDFPGYPLFQTHMVRGAVIPPYRDSVEQMFYVVKGRMRVVLSGLEVEVTTGACIRSLPGQAVDFSALDETVFIQTAVS